MRPARTRLPLARVSELLDGEILVTPSPELVHQRIALRLALLMDPFVRANGLGELVITPFDVRFGDRTVAQTDLPVRRASWSNVGGRTTNGQRS